MENISDDKEFINKPSRILHLVLFSHDNGGPYDSMYSLLSPYYKTFRPQVQTYFYTFSETIIQPYEMKDDILYIRGKESFIPGILEKTIQSLDIFRDTLPNYDYVLRTNISTIVNFRLLFPVLQSFSMEYGSANLFTLAWLDGSCGINDKTWFGTKVASGTCIILSSKTASKIVQNKDLLRRELIDDVSIGVFIREHCPDINPVALNQDHYCMVDAYLSEKPNPQELLTRLVDENNVVFYRNRHHGDRNEDVKHMRTIIALLKNQ